jgi:large subunit ribosomal protein L25
MEKVVLKAVRRDVIGKQVKVLRREGKLPAVVYGHHLEPLPILLDAKDAGKLLTGLAPSSLVTVEVDGKSYPTLVREKQRNKILGSLIHVDFLAVSMEEKLRAEVSISIVGVSPAVKDYNGILVQGLNTLEVECLPEDLPEKVVVDISGLAQVGDTIYVRDLTLSDRVKILEDGDSVLISVTAQAAEEVVEEVAPVEPEVLEKGKKEEEEEE